MPRTGRVADDVAADWLDDLAARCTHVGVGSGDPFAVMDPLTVEPISVVYHRVTAAFLRVSNLLHNDGDWSWVGLPPGTVVTYYIGWDAAVNGNVVFAAPRSALAFPDGGGFTVPDGEFFFGIAA